MVDLIAFNFALRIVHLGVVDVSLVIDVSYVHLDYSARGMSGLGVPDHMIADFEFMRRGYLR